MERDGGGAVRRANLPSAVLERRVIPVLRGLDPDRSGVVTGVLRNAGVDVVEITMDSPDATVSIEAMAREGATVGAGTVMSVTEADDAVAAGATFLVSPHTDLKVVSWAVERGIPMIPGAFTPTEVATAWGAGVAAVKVFPASIVGPGIVSALRGPFGDLPLIPTGGITAVNAVSYLEAGATAVGVGGWLTDQDDLTVIAERAAAMVEVCRAE
jgi:2-dehydro-3-deoxyphosphogluconate aldolase/(4S)-4-hydroxy-2-oxoglutarate aldolase